MSRNGRVEGAKVRRKPVAASVASRPELRGSVDRLVTKVGNRRGDAEFGAAFRAGGLVRHLRREAKLSQRELGKALGVSQARISEIEAGVGAQGPTWALMERIAVACGRNVGVMPVESPSPEQLKNVVGDAKTALERSAKIAEELAKLTRGNIEALVASSKTSAKGEEALGRNPARDSRSSFEEVSAAFKSFADVKLATDFFKLQGDYARAAFDSAVAESARLSQTVLNLSGDSAVAENVRLRNALEEVQMATNEASLGAAAGAGLRRRRGRIRGASSD